MRLAMEADKEKVLSFLEKDLGNCVYLYLDVKKYGLECNHITVWINDDTVLHTVVMRYYDSIQIYAKIQEADIEGIYECICRENVQMISGQKEVMDKLMEYQDIPCMYDSKDGYVFLYEDYREFVIEGIERATEKECAEIAHLICMDQNFKENYDESNLAEQLANRIRTGMGRSYIIRKDGIIIAHIATYAEDMGIAVASGLIVHPEYRNYLYGVIMESYLVNALKREGFKIYTMVNEEQRADLLRNMGNYECGQYMKLVKRKA